MKFWIRALAIAAFALSFGHVSAQDALSVTITPPLFQLTIGPGENWSSSVKVVNNNNFDVTYAPKVVDFEAQGETGLGSFVPLVENFANEPLATNSLGSWIEISAEPILIPAGRSGEIPFTVRVPENADPGGHYAAIMVGPYQGEQSLSGSQMRISSFVTSLLFVRIKGEIIESGRIREFTTNKSLYQTPEADFVLRFENTGNTHLRPQGAITLYNMWGKKRGEVLINEKSSFGNVLPRSIRKFEFSWSGEASILDIGRYSADVTLAYGDESKQNTSAKTYFWVVPMVPVAVTLGVVLTIVTLMTWLIRRYIRRALELERIYRGIPEGHTAVAPVAAAPISTIHALVQPIKQGVVDLRSVGSVATTPAVGNPSESVRPLSAGAFVSKYKLFFLFVFILGLVIYGAVHYMSAVLQPERGFEITTVEEGPQLPGREQ